MLEHHQGQQRVELDAQGSVAGGDLAQHPGRVFSRQQLLSDVWGYDYYGGTRTVDVHVRRLRAKLGPEYESVIGTVRNVGYRFVTPADEPGREPNRVSAG